MLARIGLYTTPPHPAFQRGPSLSWVFPIQPAACLVSGSGHSLTPAKFLLVLLPSGSVPHSCHFTLALASPISLDAGMSPLLLGRPLLAVPSAAPGATPPPPSSLGGHPPAAPGLLSALRLVQNKKEHTQKPVPRMSLVQSAHTWDSIPQKSVATRGD